MDVIRRALAAFRAFADRHPRIVRFAVLALFFAALVPQLTRLVPRDRTFVYDLGAAHSSYNLLRLAYVVRGQHEARVLNLRFPNGAPREYRHRVELPTGRYEIHAQLIGPDESEEYTRYVDLAREPEIHVRLENVNPFTRTRVGFQP